MQYCPHGQGLEYADTVSAFSHELYSIQYTRILFAILFAIFKNNLPHCFYCSKADEIKFLNQKNYKNCFDTFPKTSDAVVPSSNPTNLTVKNSCKVTKYTV